jgi:trimeric autotransporter adhesin
MALTKQQLLALNNSSFPNNNAGYITPELLRTYNSSSIGAFVDEIDYTIDSASVDLRLDNLENFSSSLVTNFATVAYVNGVSASLTSTASFNAYTQSTNNTINGLATTASVNQLTASINSVSSSVGLLQTFSGSQYKADSASFSNRIVAAENTGYVTTASFNSYTQSTDTKINSLNTISASYLSFTQSYYSDSSSFSSRIEAIDDDNVTTASFNAFTQSYYSDSASFDSRLDSTATTGSNIFNGNQTINGNVSASSFVSASKFIGDGSQLTGVTASVSIAILDEGVYQGNATSLNFTGSGLTASVVAGIALIQAEVDLATLNKYTLTSSFNSFTSSYNTFSGSEYKADSASFDSRLDAIDISVYVSTASFNAYTQSTNNFTASISTSVGLLETFSASSDSRYVQNSQTSSMAVSSSTYAVTASYALNAQTASEARNVVVIARNGNQSTLGAGTVVRITSAVGDNPIFNTSSYDNETLSSNTLGILRTSIASGADGEVVVTGVVLGVNTNPANGYVAGDVIYLGANGTFTKTQPQAPLQTVTLGEVLRAQQNNGSIYVNISNGWELNELHNVQINTPLTNDLLAYESSSYGLWKNKSAATLGLATTGSNSFTGSQIITGSLTVLGNLTAYTASFVTVTSSVVVGGNTILLNTFTPSVRYGGIEVIDSGSSGLTGSMLWDSQNDVWIYVNPTGSAYASARLISGPKSLTLGSEPTLTQNTITKADDGDHLVDSQITDDGTTVRVTNAISASTFTGLGNLTLYSASVDSRLDNLELGSSSVSTSVGLLQTFSSSQYKNDSSSFDSRLDSIETAGYVTSTTFNAYTQSTNDFTASITSSYNATSSSLNSVSSSLLEVSSSLLAVSGTVYTNTNSIIGINAKTASFATTGSNNFIGNQSITGSLILSSSAAIELQVIGAVEITGSVAGNITALSVASSTASIDFNLGTFFTLTIPSSTITYITGSNLKPGMTANIVLTQQSTTGSVRWESSLFKFPSGSINTGSAVASAVDLVSVMSVNTTTLLSVGANRLT